MLPGEASGGAPLLQVGAAHAEVEEFRLVRKLSGFQGCEGGVVGARCTFRTSCLGGSYMKGFRALGLDL
jgi:hypothetical protein